MKGLILSGGSGTRMRPLTHSTAKQLLPIANKPILHRAIEQMAAVGISEIAIVVGFTAQQVKESVGDGSQFGVRVTYLQQDKPLGLAHCVKIAQDFLNADDFIMFLGDNMFERGLEEIIASFESRKRETRFAAQISVKKVLDPASFGVAVIDNAGNLIAVEEKPAHPKSDLALVGTYCFTSAIHYAIERTSPSLRGELEITDAIQELLSSNHIVGVNEVSGWWFDTGNPEAFLECNARLLDAINQAQHINMLGVSVIDPCIIDPSASLSNCSIGPHVSIGPNVRVVGVNICNSVLLDDSEVSGSGSLKNSILGKRGSVALTSGANAEIILGDDCSMEVTS